MSNYLAGVIDQLSNVQFFLADINSDGDIDITDLIMLKQIIAGLDPFSCVPSEEELSEILAEIGA